MLPVSYSIFSALLGTQSVLFSKSLSVLLRVTFQGDIQVGRGAAFAEPCNAGTRCSCFFGSRPGMQGGSVNQAY